METIDGNSLKIRSMVSGDVTPILGIWWHEITQEQKTMLDHQIRGPSDLSFIAELEGQLVGFLLARLSYLGLPMAGVAVIHTIAVKPEYQEKGIGRLLVEHLNSHCVAQGINKMRALIPQDNIKLISYFNEFGFHPSSTINYDRYCK